MCRSRNFHSKKTRVTRKKGGVKFKTTTPRPTSSASAIASYKKYRDNSLSLSNKRKNYVNDVPLTASRNATEKENKASLSRSSTALSLGERYAPLNEAYTLRKILKKQLHALESMKEELEQKNNKDEDDNTNLLEIKSIINENKYLLRPKTPYSVNVAEADTTSSNINRYMSTAKLVKSLLKKIRKK